MTYEELLNLEETEQQEAIRGALEQLNNLQAERNSLVEENQRLREEAKAAKASEAKTKEMNYTLARRLDLDSKPKKPIEEVMKEMFS